MPKFFLLISMTCLLMSLLCCGKVDAQPDAIEKPDFGKGEFENVAERMERLLTLKWDGQNIALDRTWNEAKKIKKADEDSPDLEATIKALVARGTPEDRAKELAKEMVEKSELETKIDELIARGIPEAQAKQLAERMVAREAGFNGLRGGRLGINHERSPVEKAFFDVPRKDPNGRGGRKQSRSGNANNLQLRLSNDQISSNAIISNEDMRFAFQEIAAPERSFEFRDNGDGAVHFQFSHGESFIRLRQQKNGNTQLIWIENDQANVYLGETFAQFIEKNPQATEKVLFPLFDRLGIKMPTNKDGLKGGEKLKLKKPERTGGDH